VSVAAVAAAMGLAVVVGKTWNDVVKGVTVTVLWSLATTTEGLFLETAAADVVVLDDTNTFLSIISSSSSPCSSSFAETTLMYMAHPLDMMDVVMGLHDGGIKL